MLITIKVEKEVDVKTLHVEAAVRSWEDATVNGVDDEGGLLIPCREGNLWKPMIDLVSGVIKNWNKGTVAEIHYKVCDAGCYYLKDKEGVSVLSIINNYVPSILCPEENGYGDYIIMKVQENGYISNWNPDLSDFIQKAE